MIRTQVKVGLFFLSLCFPLSSFADFVGAKLGVDVWKSEPKGETTKALTFDSTTDYSIRAAIEHPIPALPNIQVRYKRFNPNNKTSSITDKYADVTDVILYYGIFSNRLVTFNFGLAYESVGGSMQTDTAAAVDLANQNIMGHLYGEVGLLGTGMFLFVDTLNGIMQTKEYDLQAGLGYKIAGIFRMKLGYQKTHLERDKKNKLTYTVDNDGYFVGLAIDI